MKLYYTGTAAFFALVTLLLYTIVEMRRGIFLPSNEYLKIGTPSAILYLNPIHLPLLLVGGIGAWLTYRYLERSSRNLRGQGVDLSFSTKLLGIGILVFLIVDLYAYRIVPASRIAASGKISVGNTFPWTTLPWWLQPLGASVDYLLLVWHATILGMLIGALFITFLAGFLKSKMQGTGFKSQIAGAALAVTTPFCSCCAAPIGCTVYRGGASLGPTLAYVVSAPMLNLTSLALATILLPAEFAFTRIVSGIIVGIFVTYTVSFIASKWMLKGEVEANPSRLVQLMSRALNRYTRLFHLEEFLQGKTIDSPAALISTWLSTAWKLIKIMIPIFIVATAMTAAIFMALPPLKNDAVSVILAAAFGVIFMVPTWTEIPVALGLISAGLNGPAAAMLVALPAVSIPCLVIIGGGVGNQKVAILLGLLVFITAVSTGLVFL